MKLLAILISFFVVQSTYAEIVVYDDENNKLKLSQPAQRIISLAPHITEMIYAAGAGDKLVAAVSYSDYPDAAKKLPRVGSYNKINIEALLLHDADLIIAWGSSGSTRVQVEKIKSLGIPMYIHNPQFIRDIPKTLLHIGKLAGTTAQAQQAVNHFQHFYQHIENQYRKKQPVSVFYQIWDTPLMTVNGKHFISDAIRLCGGQNVFADLPALAAKISPESVISHKPQVIIAGGMRGEKVNWLDQWRDWPQIPAVKNMQLYSIPPDILQRHSPRILLGAEKLCKMIDQAREVYVKK